MRKIEGRAIGKMLRLAEIFGNIDNSHPCKAEQSILIRDAILLSEKEERCLISNTLKA